MTRPTRPETARDYSSRARTKLETKPKEDDSGVRVAGLGTKPKTHQGMIQDDFRWYFIKQPKRNSIKDLRTSYREHTPTEKEKLAIKERFGPTLKGKARFEARLSESAAKKLGRR